MSALLRVENLHTHVVLKDQTIKAVNGVSFSVAPGEIVGVAGESGSGKTLTGMSIIGLTQSPIKIISGNIQLDGDDLRSASPETLRKLRGQKIAMVFQDPMMTLNPVLRIDVQMMEMINAHEKVSKSEARTRCVTALAKVGIPEPERRLHQYPHELSGGMRQRVAIATAMLLSPKLIIADEPTTALDVTVQAQILKEMQALCKENGTALIWITHDLAVLAQIADRIVIMYDGKIVETGTAKQILLKPKHTYTQSLLASLPKAAPDADKGKHIVTDSAPTLIKLTNVHKTFGKQSGLLGKFAQRLRLTTAPLITDAVIDANIDIKRGEIFALVGESGSGKSTLGRLACGLLQPTGGRVEYNGVESFRPKTQNAKQARLAVQMVFQDPQSSLNPRMRVLDIIGQAPLAHGLVSRANLEDYVSKQLERVGLDISIKDRFPHEFSGGQRQRISIARALAVNPKVLILDEAIASLDVSIQAKILNLLAKLRNELELTYIFISHDLGVVEHISDRVAVMQKGRIVETGPTREIFANPKHIYTQTLLNDVPRIDALNHI
ncbi:MAG: ABC transporter ATP-binding protein [Robiginitomaculum sp.]|nr:MAG: ABC transporter ATP-binding protein [Robiginitomaculum sp.]